MSHSKQEKTPYSSNSVSSTKKNKLQPQLVVCIERLPVIIKTDKDTNAIQLTDEEDCSQHRWQNCVLGKHGIKTEEFCDEQGKDVSFNVRENSILSPNNTSFTKKNKFQPRLAVHIERLAIVIKADDDTNTDQLTSKDHEFSGKQILYEYFVPESIKQEEIDIKSEEEGDDFSTDEVNEKEAQEEYLDSESIRPDKIDTKPANKEGNQFKIASGVDSGTGIHPTNKAARSNKFLLINTSSHRANIEEPPVFKCLKCSYQTHKKQLIKDHVLCHMPKTLKCPLCPYKSNNKKSLRLHQLNHIPKEEARLHKCPKCPFTSKRKGCLTRHLLIHKKLDEITWYECDECPYKSKRKGNLKKHSWLHSNNLPIYKCSLCSYGSFRKDNFQSHLNRMHNYKDRPLISCPEQSCLYKTHVSGYLQNHIRIWHNCLRNFKCSQCDFETKQLTVLQAHDRKHENHDKWFSCSLCQFKTTYTFAFTRHALVHKSASEINWFRCSKCSFKAKRKYILRRHRKLKHTRSSKAKEFTGWFCCYLCTWKTYYKHSLVNHIRVKHRDAEGRIFGHL